MSQTNVQFSVAAHVMAALGYHYGKHLTSATLAESVNAEPTFTRRTVSKLAKAGLIVATRGRLGCCTLARAPEDISLLEIYRASQAPKAFAVHGYEVEKTCPVSGSIKGILGEVLDSAQVSFEADLAGRTLADIVRGIPKTRKKK